MQRIRWQWWLASGLVLALALALLIVSPLAAQSPAPSTQQMVGAVCPLSDEQTQQATLAFDQLAVTFTTEPRCVNCHGAINPFASDGNQTHIGGRMEVKFKVVPTTVDGIVLPAIQADEDATKGQCQNCHSELPGWELAPAGDVFKGRTPIQLCANQKNVFGRQLKKGPAGFADHIDHDVKNVPFIANAFQGTRALDENGQAVYFNATGNPFEPVKPRNMTKAQLTLLARQWADALGRNFVGDDECGCVPHHYAILLEQKVDINSRFDDSTITIRSSGQVKIPISFKDDRSFTGVGEFNQVVDVTTQGPDDSCAGTNNSNNVKWTLSGSVVGSDMDNPGVMHLKVIKDSGQIKIHATCRTTDGQTLSRDFVMPGGSGSADVPDMAAVVGQTTDKDLPIANLSGLSMAKLTIVQID